MRCGIDLLTEGFLGSWDALAASRVYEGHGERSIFEDGAGSVRGGCYYDDYLIVKREH